MTDPVHGERQFTQKQVSALLRRAAELQNAAGEAAATSDPASGFSLAQLQQAAAELGIHPEFLTAAAAEMEGGSRPSDGTSFWGGPRVTELVRSVEGTVSEEEWPKILEEIRRVTGRDGSPTLLGKTFEWQDGRRGVMDRLLVTITPEGEKTRVRVLSRHAIGIILYPLAAEFAFVAGTILTSALHPGALAGVGLFAGLLGGAFMAARTGFNAICRHKARRAHAVMQALEKWIARPAAPHTQVQTSSATTEAPVEHKLGLGH
jgi:hypothetical protein